MKKSKKSPTYLVFPIFALLSIYLIVGLIAITNLKIDSIVVQKTITNLDSKDIFAHFLRAENHYSPPTEVLLKERKVAEDKLKQIENNSPKNDTQVSPVNKNTVYIYQTHSWESFLPLLEDAKIPDEAISNDERANVIGLGQRMSQNLINKGIGTVHHVFSMDT